MGAVVSRMRRALVAKILILLMAPLLVFSIAGAIAPAPATAAPEGALRPVTLDTADHGDADTTGEPCAVYPMAVSQETLQDLQPGAVVDDVLNSARWGHSGWLTWNGQQSPKGLVTALTPPGTVSSYRNPTDPSDRDLSAGDWVSGLMGRSSTKTVRAALDGLVQAGQDITVPVWDRTAGWGPWVRYHITGFARIQLTGHDLPKARISATYTSGPHESCALATDSPLTLATTTLPTAVAGTAYPDTALTATGGTPPYKWSASGLPEGLALSEDGTLTGTPTTAGDYEVAVTVTDARSSQTTATLPLTLVAAESTPVLTVDATVEGLSVTVGPVLPAGQTWEVLLDRQDTTGWVLFTTLTTSGQVTTVSVESGTYRVSVPAGQYGFGGAETQQTWYPDGAGTVEQVARVQVEDSLQPGQTLEYLGTQETVEGDEIVALQYTVGGVPVLGAQAIVGVDGQTITTSNDQSPLTPSTFSTTPTLSSGEAISTAVTWAATRTGADPALLTPNTPTLFVLEPARLYLDNSSPAVLVWSVNVSVSESLEAFQVLVDAHTGTVVTSFDLWLSADVAVCDAGGTSSDVPCMHADRTTGDAPVGGNGAVDAAYESMKDASEYFWTMFSRTSFDGNPSTVVRATVNGNWSSYSAQYHLKYKAFFFAGGMERADDVVAHEYTHAITHSFPQGGLLNGPQSGAIDEALSDIFGEFIDQQNESGNDDPSVRWLIGEDLPHVSANRAYRSMQDPSLNYELNSATKDDPYDFTPQPGAPVVGGENWIWQAPASDTTARYINIGVGTRFAYLLTDGGDGVTGIGSDKAARIIYRAAQHLTPTANYAQLGAQLVNACDFFASSGAHRVTTDDCYQTRAAATKVGMLTEPPTDRGGNDYIARDPSTGRAVRVLDGEVQKIADGGMFNCLAKTRVVWDIANLQALLQPVNSIQLTCPPADDAWTYTPTAQGGNTGTDVILRNEAGNAWLINSAGEIQTIPDGGTYLCLAASNPIIWNVPDDKINTWTPIGTAPATCGPTSTFTTRVSGSVGDPQISANGLYVAYSSEGSNIVPGDTNGLSDVFVWGRDSGTTTRISLGYDGTQTNDNSYNPAISGDGRYITYYSPASNIVPGDTNGQSDVFLWDRDTGTTTRISLATDGTQTNGSSWPGAISDDGRYITYFSDASNVVPGDTNGQSDVFLWDRDTGTTTRISLATDGTQTNRSSYYPAISGDGRYITFSSDASNLVSGDTNGQMDVFLWDRDTGTTTRISLATNGTQTNNSSHHSAISGDGRFITFTSWASNLVSGDTNERADVFLWDRDSGTTRVSVASDGAQAEISDPYFPAAGSYGAAISADGRHITYHSWASNLVEGDTNGAWDVFLWDQATRTTTRVSVADDGTQANGGGSSDSAISSDGRYITYSSSAVNVIPSDGGPGVFLTMNPLLR